VRLWKTLLLAALVAALGSYIYFVENPKMKAEAEPTRLLKFEPSDVQTLRLSYPEGVTIRVERDGKGWKMAEPLTTKADAGQIDRLLTTIHNAEVKRRIASDKLESLETYGLKDNGTQARVEITLKDGKAEPALIVGNATPVGYMAFVRLTGDKDVLVTPLLLRSGVKKTVFDLRDKTVFSVDAGNVLSVTLVRNDETIHIDRHGNDWQIVEPIKRKADAVEVTGIISAFNQLQALEFFDPKNTDEAATGLGAPTVEVTLSVGGQEPVGLRLGKLIDGSPRGYYLERQADHQIVKVAEWAKVRLDKTLATLRDKHLFACESDKVGRVQFERRDGNSFALSADDKGTWTLQPPGTPANAPVVQKTINGLTDLAAKEIVADNVTNAGDLASYGLDAPVVDVELWSKDGKDCGHALAGLVSASGKQDKYYFKKVSEDTVMTAPQYLFSRMDVRREDLLPPKPKTPPEQPSASK